MSYLMSAGLLESWNSVFRFGSPLVPAACSSCHLEQILKYLTFGAFREGMLNVTLDDAICMYVYMKGLRNGGR